MALALGYKDTVNALKSHVDEQDKAGWRITTQFGEKETTIINESGVYSLIFSSKLEGAQRFKHWVTSEVLPSIRKTGCYGTPDLSELSPELRCLIRLEQRQKQQAQELVRLNQKLDQLQGTGAFGTGGWRRESAPDHCPYRTGPGWRAVRPERLSGGIHPCWKSGSIAALPTGSKRSAASSASRA